MVVEERLSSRMRFRHGGKRDVTEYIAKVAEVRERTGIDDERENKESGGRKKAP